MNELMNSIRDISFLFQEKLSECCRMGNGVEGWVFWKSLARVLCRGIQGAADRGAV